MTGRTNSLGNIKHEDKREAYIFIRGKPKRCHRMVMKMMDVPGWNRFPP